MLPMTDGGTGTASDSRKTAGTSPPARAWGDPWRRAGPPYLQTHRPARIQRLRSAVAVCEIRTPALTTDGLRSWRLWCTGTQHAKPRWTPI